MSQQDSDVSFVDFCALCLARCFAGAVLLLIFLWPGSYAAAHFQLGSLSNAALVAEVSGDSSLADRGMDWPQWETWRRVLLLQDYNTRVVVLGTTLLGLAAGVVGSFTLLRKRALMGDALSHATLPGIGLAFILATAVGFNGKSLWILQLGGAITGTLGMSSILWIRRYTRLKEDAALGIVLSVFFGAGIAVLGIVQQMPDGHAAGLESFIYGKTASMTSMDAKMIGFAGLITSILCLAFFKELKLLCFDEGFAGSRGFPVVALDLLLMALVTVITIIGLQAVGLILMIALLVIPAAAARFWTERMTKMMVVSAVLGATSCTIGASLSAIFPRLPSGAMIVLASALAFIISMLFGPARGVVIRWTRRRRLNRKIDRQHLLRGIYEILENHSKKIPEVSEIRTETPAGTAIKLGLVQPLRYVPWDDVHRLRSWKPQRLNRCIRYALNDGLIQQNANLDIALTEPGLELAERMVHDHRLWEIYLIEHADVAPSRVDRDADRIEHVLDADLIGRLEELLQRRREIDGIPHSPHADVIAKRGQS